MYESYSRSDAGLGPALSFVIFVTIVIVLIIAGWIANIVTLVTWAGDMSAEFVLRIVGIFIPILGALMALIA